MLLQGFAVLKAELQERKAQPTGLIRLATTLGFGRLGLGPVLAAFQVRHADQCGRSASARLPDRAKKRARQRKPRWSALGHLAIAPEPRRHTSPGAGEWPAVEQLEQLGQLVRHWCLAGHSILLRRLWDIAPQLASGQLVQVLSDYFMPGADIHWLTPHRADAPRRIRLLVSFLLAQFRSQPWKANASLTSLVSLAPLSRGGPPG